jgi:5-methylcytosine-specific restriction endonuclease McrA
MSGCFKPNPLQIGERFGKWEVIEFFGKVDRALAYRCQCDCGMTRVKKAAELRHRRSSSCPSCATKKHGRSHLSQYVVDKVKTWRSLNPDRRRIHSRTYRQSHIAEILADTRLRQAVKINATPRWVDKALLKQVYRDAKAMRDQGMNVEVDHIIPLRHSLVCGLHVPWNLQIITSRENRLKGAKLNENCSIVR